MIPKKIHYCWFGGNPLPEMALKCIESWKTFLPDYEIIEWNESNYDVYKNSYIREAYENKKYAFVSDFARFDILYEYGGVYFDTDVEVINSIEDIISIGNYVGLESAGNINAGLGLGSEANNVIYKEVIDSYQNDTFVKRDGSLDLTTIVERFSEIMKKHGLNNKNEKQVIENIHVYPVDYFCPIDPATGEYTKTENTRTIHHYSATWTIPLRKKYMILRGKLARVLGIKFARIILLPLQFMCIVKEVGFKSFIKKLKRKI